MMENSLSVRLCPLIRPTLKVAVQDPWIGVLSRIQTGSGIQAQTGIIFDSRPVTLLQEVGQQCTPLRPELVGSGQTAVASDHAQVGDAQLDQVAGRRHTALPGAEVLAAGTANDRPALITERAEEVLVTD